MTSSCIRTAVAALVVALAASACGRPGQSRPATPSPATGTRTTPAAVARARADSARHPYTRADIHFMSAMIGHHAQATLMAGWAESHGASPAVRALAARIVNGQQDEIATMQQWLADRLQLVPPADPRPMTMASNGHEHGTAMPGMLTDAQLRELDAARGEQFDRLFLTYMIQHHRGAVRMVEELFRSHGAGQDETVFKFASDINVDQTTEIARMQELLADLAFAAGAP